MSLHCQALPKLETHELRHDCCFKPLSFGLQQQNQNTKFRGMVRNNSDTSS